MAAYAAVTSLMGTIHLILQSNLELRECHKEHLKLLYDKVSSLQELFDNSNSNEPKKGWKKKLYNLAQEVEDRVESQVRLLLVQDTHANKQVNKRLLVKILQQAKEAVQKELIRAVNRSIGGSSSPQLRVSTLENDMVGCNIEQQRMLAKLTGHSIQLEVLSIAGMGGIGKSTFANKMFSHPAIACFFDVRGWITMSKDYSLGKMLQSLLQDATGVKEISLQDEGNHEVSNEDKVKTKNADLADRLQKSLKGRRYLIVVDDIWSREAWDDIRLWFPENNNRSRILLTTRDMKVAQYASFPKDPFPMRFLEVEESWNLFNQKAFDQKACPVEFESIAMEVVKNCKGLPLIISVVAGIFSSKRTQNEWSKVAESVSSLVDLDDYQRCSRVLALSYNYLPSPLKACFLYFGIFPKASDISVKKLIRLWVAEGFLELKGLEGMEKVAANLLQDLIDKSLVVVSKRSSNGKISACRIHDLLHDLCLRVAENANLLYAVKSLSFGERPESIFSQGHRWVSIHSKEDPYPIFFNDLAHTKTRSLHFSSSYLSRSQYNLSLHECKLLRVLDLETICFHSLPRQIENLVFLRYVAVTILGAPKFLPIPKLWNLQTFVFPQRLPSTCVLSNEIWEMAQLRHLHSTNIVLPSPLKVSADEVKYRTLENLQSVSGLKPCCCTKEIFEGIKKVKKLGIHDDEGHLGNYVDNLIYLQELEALNITSHTSPEFIVVRRLPCPDSFPPNLKKLTLYRTNIPWEDMTIISKLPKLEVLKLKMNAFVDGENVGEDVWEVTEMGFPELKFLLLEWLYLHYWKATDDYFPSLERIIIRSCFFLNEIPEGFADSMTLQLIELHQCSYSLVNSAKRIQNEQLENLGNDMLKVYAFDTISENIIQMKKQQRKIRLKQIGAPASNVSIASFVDFTNSLREQLQEKLNARVRFR